MKLLLIWEKRSWKDTLAEIRHQEFWLSFQSSSMACCKIFLYDKLKHKYWYSNIQECYEDRHDHREEWFNLINEYHWSDRSRLAREILKESDCYVGMRNQDQFRASRKLFDLVIWVDSSTRLNKTTGFVWIQPEQADISISNNWTLKQFTEKATKLWKLLF